MLRFDDDSATASPASPGPPRTPETVRAQVLGGIAGGILSPQFANEPVHDLDVEKQAMQNGFRRVRL